MKFTWKIWLWTLFILMAIVAIANVPKVYGATVFVLGLILLFVLAKVKSKTLKFLLVIILAGAMIFLLYQQATEAVVIDTVALNTSAFDQGLRAGQVILAVNGQPVNTISDYHNIINSEFPSDENKKLEVDTDSGRIYLFIDKAPELTLKTTSPTNIKLGLDLQGGSRALVQPDTPLSGPDLQELIDVVENRLNVYGLSDLVIRPVSDLAGNNYMLVEIGGASPEELESLISEQGKFEAKIGNETVFIGGTDITHVERSGQLAGIQTCSQVDQHTYPCQFRFAIALTGAAAKKHADVTSKLPESASNPGYLSEIRDSSSSGEAPPISTSI